MTKTSPIMFKSEMILAYLDGRKNQTRRTKGLNEINKHPNTYYFYGVRNITGKGMCATFSPKTAHGWIQIKLPYGSVGDTLRFKETWKMHEREADGLDQILYKADNKLVSPDWWNQEEWTRPDPTWVGKFDKWQSAMFMPAICSRFRNVPILNVRVQRLWDITEQDAISEGWDRVNPFPEYSASHSEPARQWYFKLWDKINGKKLPASKNPWVWVYEFKPYEADHA